jgi:enoyl-CoA hydratase
VPRVTVLVERRERVLLLTLNRPEQRNALDRDAFRGLSQALADVEDDPEVGAVIITGAGDRAFCAGMDLKAFAESGAPSAEDGIAVEILTGRPYAKPLIAAVNGAAVAGGFELVLACDLVVAADHATFGLPEVKRGLVAAGGGVLRLPRRVPLAVALEMGLTGDAVDARRAYELGLVNQVVPGSDLLIAALALAERVAGNAPLALRVTKEIMREVADGDDAAARRRLTDRSLAVFTSDDAREGALAFAEKRPPRWTGH